MDVNDAITNQSLPSIKEMSLLLNSRLKAAASSAMSIASK